MKSINFIYSYHICINIYNNVFGNFSDIRSKDVWERLLGHPPVRGPLYLRWSQWNTLHLRPPLHDRSSGGTSAGHLLAGPLQEVDSCAVTSFHGSLMLKYILSMDQFFVGSFGYLSALDEIAQIKILYDFVIAESYWHFKVIIFTFLFISPVFHISSDAVHERHLCVDQLLLSNSVAVCWSQYSGHAISEENQTRLTQTNQGQHNSPRNLPGLYWIPGDSSRYSRTLEHSHWHWYPSFWNSCVLYMRQVEKA